MEFTGAMSKTHASKASHSASGHRWRRLAAALLVAALMMTWMIGSAAAEAAGEIGALPFGKTEAVMTGKVFPYVKDFRGPEYEQGEVTLYFMDGGDIPYVALSEYMPLLSEVLEKNAGRPGITYDISLFDDHVYRVRRTDVESEMWFDTQDNIIYLDNFNGFTLSADVIASVALMDLPDPKPVDIDAVFEEARLLPEAEQMDYISEHLRQSDKPEAMFAAIGDTVNRGGKPITLYMSDYLIDLVEQDGECFVPLQTMTDLFMGSQYLYFIFNEEALYCVSYGNDALLEQVCQVEPKEMSSEFALFNYNELRFLLDCNYGLKPEHAIDDFATLMAHNTNLVSSLVSTDPARFDDALARLTYSYFDDGHSGFLQSSWRTASGSFSPLSYMGLGASTGMSLQGRYQKARSAAFPGGIPMYQEVGDTAFITFDTFYSDDEFSNYYHMDEPTADEFIIPASAGNEAFDMEPDGEEADELADTDPEEIADIDLSEYMDADTGEDFDGDYYEEDEEEEELPPDTIRLLIYARKQILREGSPIKNVVVDLSLNGGGKSDAAIYVLAWMIGQANIAVRDTFTGAETIMRLGADLNLTEDYDSTYQGMTEYCNVYCLTSPCSFSCGNLVPAACKMSERVTLIGRASGGGSCAVQTHTSASGAIFQISGHTQLSTVRNGSFYNIDQGIEPDVVLTKTESFYDREALVEMIHDLK